MKVLFHQKVNAIAPGQAAVFYEGKDVIGGGWILKSFHQKQEIDQEQKPHILLIARYGSVKVN